MLSLQWHCENFKLLWPNRNFWMCWIYSILSFVLSRWNSQTSGPLAISGPQNTPVLHHCCPTSHLSLSSCTAFNTALFYLAKCGLTGRPVTFQRCRTILKSVIVRNQSFFSMCCERNTMAAVVLWPPGSSRRNQILKDIRVFETAFLDTLVASVMVANHSRHATLINRPNKNPQRFVNDVLRTARLELWSSLSCILRYPD